MAEYIGLQYPLEKTPRGLMAQNRGIDQVKADLLQLLLTNPGERIMLPNFGTPLRELFFEPNDSILEIEAERMISESIQAWEPRIEVKDITVTSKFSKNDLSSEDSDDDRESILGIKIEFYDPINITQVEMLVLELPFGGN